MKETQTHAHTHRHTRTTKLTKAPPVKLWLCKLHFYSIAAII
uniref:Uncharacterized protein n=1 Tax=Anguilla anguilla TaxID=7936 RepID=A0A0E9RIE2_ANGAN